MCACSWVCMFVCACFINWPFWTAFDMIVHFLISEKAWSEFTFLFSIVSNNDYLKIYVTEDWFFILVLFLQPIALMRDHHCKISLTLMLSWQQMPRYCYFHTWWRYSTVPIKRSRLSKFPPLSMEAQHWIWFELCSLSSLISCSEQHGACCFV